MLDRQGGAEHQVVTAGGRELHRGEEASFAGRVWSPSNIIMRQLQPYGQGRASRPASHGRKGGVAENGTCAGLESGELEIARKAGTELLPRREAAGERRGPARPPTRTIRAPSRKVRLQLCRPRICIPSRITGREGELLRRPIG